MFCPYCQKRLAFHVGNNKVYAIACDGDPSHEIKRGSNIFTLLESMYWASVKVQKRETDLNIQFQQDMKKARQDYQAVMTVLGTAVKYEVALENATKQNRQFR